MVRKTICTVLSIVLILLCFGCNAMSEIAPSTEYEKQTDNIVTYKDVSANDWFFENVKQMTNSGLLKGYDDGYFRPENEISGCEFVTIVDRAVGGNHNTNRTNEHWAKDVMEFAMSKSWYDYDEIPPGSYDVPITRELAVKIVMQSMISYTTGDYIKYPSAIADYTDINGRYSDIIIRAYTQGIVTGDENNKFNPKSRLSRAEACALIDRALHCNDSKTNIKTENSDIASNTILTSKDNDTVDTPFAVQGGVSKNGRLRVNGTNLVNEHNEIVQLRGMSSHGIQWYGNYTNYNSIRNIAKYGANLFRVAMYTAENGYIQNKALKEKVFAAVDNAINLDMYVIIDWHILSDGNPRTYETEAKEFFSEVSERYKGNPAVIYEICNEPNGNVTWDFDIKPYAENIIPIIREHDPQALILVGSGTWSQDFDKAADNPLNFNNIMYTCHFYAGTHGQWLRDRIDYALSKGIPIFVSEWGTSSADGNGGVYLNDSYIWLCFLNERNISWANWSLCDKNESSAALVNGTSADGEWNDENLTESGKFVFSNFH